MNADEFRKLLLDKQCDEIVDNFILTDDPGPYTTRQALTEIEDRSKAVFGLTGEQSVKAVVVGSAKLGFAFLEKPARNGNRYKPAYRTYQPGESDIDVAIVSPHLYGRIWHDLALFGVNQQNFPWRTDLAPYMLHGWIRPDKFPTAAPQRCNDWKDMINDLSRGEHFRYKKLRCAIYHSRFFLKIYQQRGIAAAQQAKRVA